jgi:hypothetical protein
MMQMALNAPHNGNPISAADWARSLLQSLRLPDDAERGITQEVRRDVDNADQRQTNNQRSDY